MTNEERRRVESALGDGRQICDQCGATLGTYADKCNARLGAACQGFNAIEAAATNRHVVH